MSSERVTEAELSRSRKARTIAKNWLEAEETRMKLAGLDPALEGDGTPGVQMRPSKFGRPSALERVKEARISGMEVAHFEKGLSGANEGAGQQKPPQTNPMALVQQKAEIIKALAPNHSPEQIAQYLEKISPFLDTAMLAGSDPLAQSLLYAKVMSSNQQPLGLKDVIELVGIVNQAKSQQPQLDPASVMNAAGNLFRTGIETARGRNDSVDMTQVLQMQQQSHDRMIQAQQEHFREIRELQSQQPTLVDSLRQYRELQGLVGTAPDRPEVAMKKLDLQAAAEQREHEYRLESAKEKRQGELIKGITGGLSHALENPVVRELGRSVGSKIGVRENPLAAAQTKAAQQQVKQLSDPTQVTYGFTCSGCKQPKTFTALQLETIREMNGGRWVCDSVGCSNVYQLQGEQGKEGQE